MVTNLKKMNDKMVDDYLRHIITLPTPGDFMSLTGMQAETGVFTFLTLDEWLNLPWPKMDDLEEKEMDRGVLFGAYVSWYSFYLQEVCKYSFQHQKGPAVVRLSNQIVAETMIEVRKTPDQVYSNLIVSMAPLIAFPGSFYTACLACGLFTRTGTFIGGALGWNTGTTLPAVTYNELLNWAEYWGGREMHIMCNEASPSILDLSKLTEILPVHREKPHKDTAHRVYQ